MLLAVHWGGALPLSEIRQSYTSIFILLISNCDVEALHSKPARVPLLWPWPDPTLHPGLLVLTSQIFDQAEALGYDMELLDIGGGFTGQFDSHGNVMFGDIAHAINSAIAQHFPPESGVRVISEPGRYFAETAATLMVPIYGQRERVNKAGVPTKEYWLTDGLYGSFNCIIYDEQNPAYQVNSRGCRHMVGRAAHA